MYNGELSEHEYVRDYSEARRVTIRNPEFLFEKSSIFKTLSFAEFMELDLHDTRCKQH